MISPKTLIVAILLLAVAALALMYIVPGRGSGREVVVYTSVDSEYALPLFKRFNAETGIDVVHRTDSEATKTTGLALQLLSMKDKPDGDVFWNSELSFTQMLAANDVLVPYLSPQATDIPTHYKDALGRWTAFGCRARVLIYNTRAVKAEELPKTLEDLALPRWKGRFAIAKPLFGTTRSHFVSLALLLGEEKAFALFRAWRDNGVVIANSNGDVRNRVAEGILDIGLTDTDDVFSAMDRGKPVDYIVIDQTPELRGAYLIPNTVAVLKNCKRPANARAFIDFLLRPETEKWLAEQGARQIPVRPLNVALPERLQKLTPVPVDAEALAQKTTALGERIYRILSGEEK